MRGRKTLVISTHILQEVDAVADRILLIHRGRLVFDGTMADVRGRGTVEELFHRLTRDGASGVNLAFSRALGLRDLRRYFENPTGYVFITLFIFLSAAAAFWRPRFFLNNLATLDQINEVFPFLLLFFIPALTMGVWAEERREGTDELLLTLPASDLAIVLGKYLAVLGVYTISLVLSLSHVAVLLWLGSPDGGLMAANYAGLLDGRGVAHRPRHDRIAAGIARHGGVRAGGALLRGSRPGGAGGGHSSATGSAATWRHLGLGVHFADFSRGVVSLSAVLYFVLLGVLGLYANVVLLDRRHWTASGHGPPLRRPRQFPGRGLRRALCSSRRSPGCAPT